MTLIKFSRSHVNFNVSDFPQLKLGNYRVDFHVLFRIGFCRPAHDTAGPIGLRFGLWVTYGPDSCMAKIQLSSFDLDLARGQK